MENYRFQERGKRHVNIRQPEMYMEYDSSTTRSTKRSVK